MESTWSRRLARGGLSGLAGGVASIAVLWIAVEPAIDQAIALEGAAEAHTHSAADGAHVHSADSGEVVTRLQQQVGGSLTVLIVAALMGVAFAAVYARSRHRLPGQSDLGRSLMLSAIAFAVMALGPAVAIPANPPGVGDPETVNHRTLSYLLVIALGALTVGAAFGVRRWLADRGGTPEISWLVVAATVLVGVVVILLAPAPDDRVPVTMPAALLWEFRVGSLAQLAAMWGTIGLVHGVLVRRAADRRLESAPPRLVNA